LIKSTWRAALLLGAVFLGGVLAGSGGLVLAHRAGLLAAPGGRRSTEAYLHRLTGDLKLTAQQQDSVRGILERYRPAMDSLRQDVDARFSALRASIRGEIKGVLTPEQQQRYDELTQRMDAERKRTGR
jgi:Spy/CpxP family protein refolding chaperone